MLLAEHSVENAVVEILRRGPSATSDMLSALREKRPRATKQGMYAALRKLKKEEVVVKHRNRVFLNIAWITKVESFISLAHHYHSQNAGSGSFLDLKDGDRIRYEFNDPSATDAFWNHVLYMLVETHTGIPWFGYNPHCWFLLVRKESERALRDFIVKNGGQYLILSDSKRPLDKAVRKEFNGTRSQYHMRERPLVPRGNYYFNIIDDFIIEIWLHPAHAQEIEDIYASAQGMTPDVEDRLRDAIRSKGRTKLVVSRNRAKAEKLRAKIAKYFHILKA